MPASAAAPLTYDEVIDVAQALASAGRKASSVAVRERLGRGSFSTIRKHLDRWQAEQAPMTSPPSPMPSQLETLWLEARREADRALVADREEVKRLSEQLDERWEGLEAAVRAAEALRDAAEQRLADKDAELQRLEPVLANLRQRCEQLEVGAAAAADEHQRERVAWSQRLESVESRITELTCALTGVAKPVRRLRRDVESLSVDVDARFEQVRRELVEGRSADLKSISSMVMPPLTAVAGTVDEIRRQLRRQRPLQKDHPRRRSRYD